MLDKPHHERMVAAIQQSTTLDLDRLRIIRKLPQEACTAAIAACVGSLRAAGDVATIVALLLEHGIDRSALTRAFNEVKDAPGLTRMMKRWTLKLALPPHPVPSSDAYQPITTAAELASVARRYRNCMVHHLPGVLDGADAFAEFRRNQSVRGMIVHLRRRDDVWVVEGTYGVSNTRPNPNEDCAALSYLERQGVLPPARSRTESGQWAALTRLTSQWMFEEQNE